LKNSQVADFSGDPANDRVASRFSLGGIMRALLLLLAVTFSSQGFALQFMKCNSLEHKTFWASFGKLTKSGEEPTYFPIDFTLLNGEKSLQDRIYYYSTKEALKVPLEVGAGAIRFSFAAKSADGVSDQTEAFDLHLISPKDLTGFQGSWTTYNAQNIMIQQVRVMCSAL
jgi:hypothetical protein